MVLSNARPGCTVVIESSVSIGTTQVTLGPFQDIISCGVSAERVDPGRIAPAEHEISKIVSGLTKAALLEKQNLYSLPGCRSSTNDHCGCYRAIQIPEFGLRLGGGGHRIPVNLFYLFTNNDNLPVFQQSTDQV